MTANESGKDLRESVRGWWNRGEGDLGAARAILEFDVDDYFSAAFHAQQAAEKFLGAFLITRGAKQMDQIELQDALIMLEQYEPRLRAELHAASALASYRSRRTDPKRAPVDRQTAHEAIDQARFVRGVVSKRIKEWLA